MTTQTTTQTTPTPLTTLDDLLSNSFEENDALLSRASVRKHLFSSSQKSRFFVEDLNKTSSEEEEEDAEEEEEEEAVVEEESNMTVEEKEILELGEALEDELDEIIKPMGNATTENIGYIETMEGFDVRLPKESIEQITRTIAMTPHEGFKPVVRVNMLGQIVLDFEPL